MSRYTYNEIQLIRHLLVYGFAGLSIAKQFVCVCVCCWGQKTTMREEVKLVMYDNFFCKISSSFMEVVVAQKIFKALIRFMMQRNINLHFDLKVCCLLMGVKYFFLLRSNCFHNNNKICQ